MMVCKKIVGTNKCIIDYTIIYEINSGERTRGNSSKRNKKYLRLQVKKVGGKGIWRHGNIC